MAFRGDPRSSRAWKRRRAYVIATTPRPVMCWRCEQEITDVENAHLGHLVDQAVTAPGTPVRVALEHPRCSVEAGLLLGRELQRNRGGLPRQNAPYVSARLNPR